MEGTKKKKDVDFTSGPIMSKILIFGLPILLGSIFQQMYNMVDSIVVGNFVGTPALAAVGNASTIAFCLVNVATGLTNGASVVISQLIGAKAYKEIKKAMSTTLIFALAVAAFLSIIGVVFARTFMGWLKVPEELMDDSCLYMMIFCGGSIFLMLYNFFAAMLRAFGDSKTPLMFLIVSSVLNVVGDLFFVVVLNLGVAGVAIATILAQTISVLLCVIYCRRKVEYFNYKKGEFVFDKVLLKDIVRLSVPSAIQFTAGSLGFVFVQGLINSFGTDFIAAYTATSKIEGFAHLPIDCFALSLSVFVGQNIGAGNLARVKQALIRVMLVLGAICISIAVVVYAAGPQMVSWFVGIEQAEVISIGTKFLRIWAPITVTFAIMNSFNSVLRGAGDSIFVMLSSFLDVGVRTVAAYIIVLGLGFDFYGIAYAMVIGWLSSLIEVSIRYFTGKWKTKSIAAAKEAQA